MGLHKFHYIDSIVSIRVWNTLSLAPDLGANMIMILIKGGVKPSIIISKYDKVRGIRMLSDDRIKLRPKVFFPG